MMAGSTPPELFPPGSTGLPWAALARYPPQIRSSTARSFPGIGGQTAPRTNGRRCLPALHPVNPLYGATGRSRYGQRPPRRGRRQERAMTVAACWWQRSACIGSAQCRRPRSPRVAVERHGAPFGDFPSQPRADWPCQAGWKMCAQNSTGWSHPRPSNVARQSLPDAVGRAKGATPLVRMGASRPIPAPSAVGAAQLLPRAACGLQTQEMPCSAGQAHPIGWARVA